MSSALPPYTLGDLISELERSENAYRENSRTADRVEAKDGHNIGSAWWRAQAAALLFQPDPARHPGIDRIEALCDEWGTGLKAENVRRLRGKLCNLLGVGTTEANVMTLEAVAAALDMGIAGVKNSTSEYVGSVSMIKVLLLSANPIDSPLRIDEEFRAIDQKIRGSEHRDHVDLIKHGAVRLEDVPGLLMRHKPHVVHFSGHGASTGIALTGGDGTGRLVPPNALVNIFRAIKDNVRVVLLNACESAQQAEAIVSEIDCAVGMSDTIDDNAAIAFAAAFYETLGYGQSVQVAFDIGRVQLTGAGADSSLVKLYNRRGVKPAELVLVNPPRPQ